MPSVHDKPVTAPGLSSTDSVAAAGQGSGQARPDLRERLLAGHHASLSDSELLAVVLGSGSRGRPVQQVAEHVLAHGHGLAGLAQLAPGALASVPGIGNAGSARILAALELGRRCRRPPRPENRVLRAPADAAGFLCHALGHYPSEVFACLFLTNRHRVLALEELFRGTIDGAAVYPREVVRRCLAHNAAAVILAHNHPSGDPTPSEADRAITLRLRDALGLVDVRMLDHLVVSDNDWISLAERGWL